MSSLTPADTEGLEYAQTVGRELGINVVRVYDRAGEGWLIHGYWKEAPVAISLRGGLGVAFWNASGKNSRGDWDEVVDTSCAGLDAAITLGAAALERYADGREATYAHTELPPPLHPQTAGHETSAT